MEATLSENNGEIPFKVKWVDPVGDSNEGSLSVLWQLIESYKVDIFDVSLSRITKDFIDFLKYTKRLSVEVGTEFALMASNLVYLKSKALLPDPGFEETESEPVLPKELVEKLLEYKKFQIATSKLFEYDKIMSCTFKRDTNQILSDFPEEETWLEVSLVDLISAFKNLLINTIHEEIPPEILISTQEISIDEKIDYISKLLKDKKEIYFSEIFTSSTVEPIEIVVSFLALLELIKIKIVVVKQHSMFDDIKIFLVNEIARESI